MATQASSSQPLALKFSHHVIEHLGLKLYQNRPANVIAELVSNSWDASAECVKITIGEDARNERFVAVADNGSGMTYDDLATNYLIIGKPKNRSQARTGPRYPMGRKGIGKLAPFGIARSIDVLTIAGEGAEREITWINLNLPDILDQGAATPPDVTATYPPTEVFRGSDNADIPLTNPQIADFLDFVGPNTGTLILLRELSLLRAIAPAQIIESLGRRFTVTLNRPDFAVEVNGTRIDIENSLPPFELRIPPEGYVTEDVGGAQVRYWVGFVGAAAWPSDEAGVGVYAHGKLAQDRPFTFGLKGREIFTRYMYAVVEADHLDELPEDVISTDRSAIDWQHPTAAVLYQWGTSKTRLWVEEYKDHRAQSEQRRVANLVETKIAAGQLPKLPKDEQEMLASILAEVTPYLSKQEAADDSVTSAVMKAYLHRPTRELLKKLWKTYAESDGDGQRFLNIVDQIAKAAIPEALSLAVEFAQRAYALSVLLDMQHKGTEPDLQKLIETFPWILRPGMENITKNQQLKTLVMEAAKRGLSPSRLDVNKMEINEGLKPDFVFLSDIPYGHIVIVELKTPREDLTLENREQLGVYMTHIEQQYPRAKREGFLVGSNGSGLDPMRSDIKILSWADVVTASRRGHIEMLAAMLRAADPDPDDARVQQILEFGGDAVWELLERISTNDEQLADLIQNRPKL